MRRLGVSSVQHLRQFDQYKQTLPYNQIIIQLFL